MWSAFPLVWSCSPHSTLSEETSWIVFLFLSLGQLSLLPLPTPSPPPCFAEPLFPSMHRTGNSSTSRDRSVGVVVKAPASRAADPGFDSRLLREDFSGWSRISDLKLDTPVPTQPGAWRYRVSAGTDWLGIQYTVTG